MISWSNEMIYFNHLLLGADKVKASKSSLSWQTSEADWKNFKLRK